jgi:N-acetylglucosamine-6-phosphate deacetylase
MAAAGVADGAYRIGPLAVDVTDGVAHLAGTETIAGSTATMDRLFRFAVAHCGLPRDEALMLAVFQSSINPARALGLPNPALQPGARADLVVLDDRLAVSTVLCGGAWISELVSGA